MHGWKAQLTVVGLEEDSRWWLTGLEWGWRVKEKGVDDPGGRGATKALDGDERQQILDLANGEVLPPRQVEESAAAHGKVGHGLERSANATKLPPPEDTTGELRGQGDGNARQVDAPLVRTYNLLRTSILAPQALLNSSSEHLSLSYQLEVLFSQAMALSQGLWRGQLLVDIDRTRKVVRVKYWM